jgi:hypothetical protein
MEDLGVPSTDDVLNVLFGEQLEVTLGELSPRDLANLSLACKKLHTAISPVMPCEQFLSVYAARKLAPNDKEILKLLRQAPYVHLIYGPHWVGKITPLSINRELLPITAYQTSCHDKCVTFCKFESRQQVHEVFEFLVRIGVDRRVIEIKETPSLGNKRYFRSIVEEIQKFAPMSVKLSIVPFRFLRADHLVFPGSGSGSGLLEVCVSVSKAHGELAGMLVKEIASVRQIACVNFYGICGSLSADDCPRFELAIPDDIILPFMENGTGGIQLKNTVQIEGARRIKCHGHVQNVLDENYFAVQRARRRGIVTVEMEAFHVVDTLCTLGSPATLHIVFEVTDIVGSRSEDLTRIQDGVSNAIRLKKRDIYDLLVRSCFWPT